MSHSHMSHALPTSKNHSTTSGWTFLTVTQLTDPLTLLVPTTVILPTTLLIIPSTVLPPTPLLETLPTPRMTLTPEYRLTCLLRLRAHIERRHIASVHMSLNQGMKPHTLPTPDLLVIPGTRATTLPMHHPTLLIPQ